MRTIEVTDKTIENLVVNFNLTAEIYSQILWEAVGDFEDKKQTIGNAWIIGGGDFDAANTYEETFFACLNLISDLGLIDDYDYCTITIDFRSLMDYPLDAESIEQWCNKLERTLTDSLSRSHANDVIQNET